MAVNKREKAGAQALPRDISKFTNRDPSADYADRTAARAAITLHHEGNSVP
jgi:hypothetical protein